VRTDNWEFGFIRRIVAYNGLNLGGVELTNQEAASRVQQQTAWKRPSAVEVRTSGPSSSRVSGRTKLYDRLRCNRDTWSNESDVRYKGTMPQSAKVGIPA
jgi:hypothetical protein